MNDNEIIKALKCCSSESGADCECCPAKNKRCDEFVMKDALDLINRQKAKNEALEMDNAQLQSDIVNANMNSDHALAEIERLKARNVNNCRNWQTKYNSLRAEAIKEFAERLKPLYKLLCVDKGDWCNEIDNLVEEMTEGKE